ncbi:hypothetical protein EX30DRAFT_369604 [Ascodesmis nigricans]|uniref:NADH dehydrogenase [ubiquinone] 1 alpha subcomplex assembly factor 3 n=1 Tax=Ascodesmis nigricans TaxID=341454 RepID=A0A4S2N5A8_9PEZI|nr:hypothetical protein EX30DRAFT_369604 [Ascodesmis nigricans]
MLSRSAPLFRPLCTRSAVSRPIVQSAFVRSYKVVSRKTPPPPPPSENVTPSRNALPKDGESTPPQSPANVFSELDVMSGVPTPGSAVETVAENGFVLSNGTRWNDGSGAMLLHNEAFKWRAAERSSEIEHKALKTGILELPDTVWGILEVIHPKPELLIVGTGNKSLMLSVKDRNRLTELGIRMDVMDTSNAAAQYNLLSTERSGMEIAAALLVYGFGKRK